MYPKASPRSLLLVVAILVVAVIAGYWVARFHDFAGTAQRLAAIRALNLTQNDDEGEVNEVSPAQVEQYLKVYEAMQRDRTLTVDQAAAQQHLTVEQFRDIEARIERDGVLRERVRRELLKMAQRKSNALKLKPQSAPSSPEQ